MVKQFLNGLQFSLRELFVIVAFAALGFSAMVFGSGWSHALFIGIVFLLVMGMVITAIFDRGLRQKFAIGFLLCFGTYEGATSYWNYETSMIFHELLTSKISSAVHSIISRDAYYDRHGNVVLDPAKFPSAQELSKEGGSLMPFPYWNIFMRDAHVLWALLIGYIGGKFTVLVYLRRMSELK